MIYSRDITYILLEYNLDRDDDINCLKSLPTRLGQAYYLSQPGWFRKNLD